jgi:hypothetical protein
MYDPQSGERQVEPCETPFNTVNSVVKRRMGRGGEGEMGREKIKDNLPAGRREGKRQKSSAAKTLTEE